MRQYVFEIDSTLVLTAVAESEADARAEIRSALLDARGEQTIDPTTQCTIDMDEVLADATGAVGACVLIDLADELELLGDDEVEAT